MAVFRRKKIILPGTHGVVIEKIEETLSKNGKKFFKITLKKKNGRAKSEFWVDEESNLIQKIINIIFQDDDREEFETIEFIGKEIVVDVKKGKGDFYNISDIRSIDEFEEVEENEIKEESYDLEKELFDEEEHDIDDFDFGDNFDDDDFDDDDIYEEDDEEDLLNF
ncbi:hypothetical protein GKD08_14810 [Paeniclostridium sordellii]|uniref:hypothetical protein n=1 Tax=Paraclostridium sordellii TaxID=1505 RepID=UPI0012B10009|nr:hypothetical protein [Paeniclostridium sordellii]MDU4414959.1 hypothetical protein [Paeniclostridium sordellii]MRZ30027.1 hypothetical protein [Paeniclostridium sordellii]